MSYPHTAVTLQSWGILLTRQTSRWNSLTPSIRRVCHKMSFIAKEAVCLQSLMSESIYRKKVGTKSCTSKSNNHNLKKKCWSKFITERVNRGWTLIIKSHFCTDGFYTRAVNVAFLRPRNSWTRENIRCILSGLRRKSTGLLHLIWKLWSIDLTLLYLFELLHPCLYSWFLRSADSSSCRYQVLRKSSEWTPSFSGAAPQLWNNLPLHIRDAYSTLMSMYFFFLFCVYLYFTVV